MPRADVIAALSLALGPGSLAAQDWWARVPAYPTACYTEADTFDEDRDALSASLQQEYERQKATNAEIQLRYTDMDPGQKQQRLVAYMQKDPAGAQQFMTRMQSMGSQENLAANQELMARESELLSQIKTAVDAAVSEFKQLPPHPDDNATTAQYRAWVGRRNSAYEALCARWFNVGTGGIPGALAEYQRWLTAEYVPAIDKKHQADKQFLVAMGIRTEGMGSTATMEAVTRFLDQMGAYKQLRPEKPLQ